MSDELGNACSGLDEGVLDELRAIARLHGDAGGLMISLANWAGEKAESLISRLPADWQAQAGDAAEVALAEAYRLAFATQPRIEDDSLVNRAFAWASGTRWHTVATAVTGALGGLGGALTTLLDLPVTTTLILRGIQQVAAEHGEDLSDPLVRAQCLAVFGLGGPLTDDDDAETGLYAARLAMTGGAAAEVLKVVLPRFGVVVNEKLLAQSIPLLGAVAGATVNPAFSRYYQTMAQVHFRLRKLERDQDSDQLRACFERIAKAEREARKRTKRRR